MKFFGLVVLLLACNGEQAKQIENLEENVTSQEENTESIAEQIAALQETISDMQTQITSLQEENSAYESRLTEIESEINTRLSEEALEAWIQDMNYMSSEEIEAYILVNVPTLSDFNDHILQLETNTSDIADIFTDISYLQSDVATNTSNISINSNDAQNIYADLSLLEDELDTIESSVANMSGSGIEPGTVAMWSGDITSIPSGWSLCDGTMGTPDLRNRFVVGAGDAYTIEETGGSGAGSVSYSTSSATLGTCNAMGCPSFTYVSGVSGSSAIPPYYALAYIVKL